MNRSDRYRLLINGEELVFSWETEEEARRAAGIAHKTLPAAEITMKRPGLPDLVLWPAKPERAESR